MSLQPLKNLKTSKLAIASMIIGFLSFTFLLYELVSASRRNGADGMLTHLHGIIFARIIGFIGSIICFIALLHIIRNYKVKKENNNLPKELIFALTGMFLALVVTTYADGYLKGIEYYSAKINSSEKNLKEIDSGAKE